VSARGPLPVVRAGAQPYGVLPLMPILTARDGSPVLADPIAIAIDRFRPGVVGPAAERSPRIRPGLAHPEETLVELLRRDGAPAGCTVRLLAAEPLSQELLALGDPWQDRRARARDRLIALLGVAPVDAARLLDLALAPRATPLALPLVTSDADRPADYLPALLETTLRDLSDPQRVGSRPLLFHLARAALLEAADETVRRVAAVDIKAQPSLWPRWSSAISTPQDQFNWTVRDRLDYLPGGPEWLDAHPQDPMASAWAEARQLIFELGRFSGPNRLFMPAVALEPLLRATLGLGHRLDAGYTSLAVRLLRDIREVRARGLTVGGYGVIDGFLAAAVPADLQVGTDFLPAYRTLTQGRDPGPRDRARRTDGSTARDAGGCLEAAEDQRGVPHRLNPERTASRAVGTQGGDRVGVDGHHGRLPLSSSVLRRAAHRRP
jgi:hypothetical protein